MFTKDEVKAMFSNEIDGISSCNDGIKRNQDMIKLTDDPAKRQVYINNISYWEKSKEHWYQMLASAINIEVTKKL